LFVLTGRAHQLDLSPVNCVTRLGHPFASVVPLPQSPALVHPFRPVRAPSPRDSQPGMSRQCQPSCAHWPRHLTCRAAHVLVPLLHSCAPIATARCRTCLAARCDWPAPWPFAEQGHRHGHRPDWLSLPDSCPPRLACSRVIGHARWCHRTDRARRSLRLAKATQPPRDAPSI
jgi:hypothetical protein